jgi:CBS domain containing-hemolysin-like protein
MIHSPFVMSLFIWVGVAFCLAQSAIFSGLNLAIFSISKLRLEVEAAGENPNAIGLLDLRKDSNLALCTILWGNVTINVLLTLLSASVLAGVGAFAFSTLDWTDRVPAIVEALQALRVCRDHDRRRGGPTEQTRCGSRRRA